MTDIWDEKPEAKTMPAVGYLIGPMDVWLEKVKAYYDVTINSIQVYEWKEKAEKYDAIKDYANRNKLDLDAFKKNADKLEAVNIALTKKYANVGHLREELAKILGCQSRREN